MATWIPSTLADTSVAPTVPLVTETVTRVPSDTTLPKLSVIAEVVTVAVLTPSSSSSDLERESVIVPEGIPGTNVMLN